MRLLLDTHVALWALFDDPRLSRNGRALLQDEANEVYVSVVSLWEIGIKWALKRTGPNAMPIDASTALELFEQAGYLVLPVQAAHAVRVETLPPLHGDPFDRLLLAQALSEPLRLLTSDRKLHAYDPIVLAL